MRKNSRKNQSEEIWKIPLPRRLTYGQCIALKQGLVAGFNDEAEPPKVQITIKSGRDDGFYVTGTREQADRVSQGLVRRTSNYYQVDADFSVEGRVSEPGRTMDPEVEEIVDQTREAIEKAVHTEYFHTIRTLNEQLSDRDGEIGRLRKDNEGLKERRLKPDNVYRAFTEEIVRTCRDPALNFNILFEGIEDVNRAVDSIRDARETPKEYASRKTAAYAMEMGVEGWKNLLDMEAVPFEESGQAPCEPREYEAAGTQRDYLLSAIENAPDEETKELLKRHLEKEMGRKRNVIDDYEEAKVEYDSRMKIVEGVKNVFETAMTEQGKRRQGIDFEAVDQLKGAKLNLYIVREGDHIKVATHKSGSEEFNQAMRRYMLSAAKGLTQKQVSERTDRLECVFYHEDKSPEDVQMELCNNLYRESGQTPFGKLGMDVTVYMLPDHL